MVNGKWFLKVLFPVKMMQTSPINYVFSSHMYMHSSYHELITGCRIPFLIDVIINTLGYLCAELLKKIHVMMSDLAKLF